MRATLTILASADNGHRALQVGGELDMATAPQLAAALASTNGERTVLVDLLGLSFIDSSGFNVLVAAHHRFESEGRRLFITGMSPIGLRAMQAAGLDKVLHLEPPDLLLVSSRSRTLASYPVDV